MSFTSMHNDYLESGNPMLEDDPPCESCKWDAGNNCVLTVGCRYEAKDASHAPVASDTQIGGNHYQEMEIQPAEFITRNKLGFLEGCVVKRICRWKKKDGIKDLRKAIHEIELLIEFELKNP